MHIDLTDDERGYVDAFIADRKAKRSLADHVTGIDYLLTTWDHFVDDVESGQGEYVVEEYLNEVSVRHILDDLTADAPADLKRKIAGAVGAVDTRYIAATDPEDPPHWSHRESFAWYRVPRWPWWEGWREP